MAVSYIGKESAVTVVTAPRCPNCGAGLTLDAVKCNYCQSNLGITMPRSEHQRVMNLTTTGQYLTVASYEGVRMLQPGSVCEFFCTTGSSK